MLYKIFRRQDAKSIGRNLHEPLFGVGTILKEIQSDGILEWDHNELKMLHKVVADDVDSFLRTGYVTWSMSRAELCTQLGFTCLHLVWMDHFQGEKIIVMF